MAVSRESAWPYAEQLLSRPARSVRVTMRRGKGGVTLLHGGRALTRCYDNGAGRLAAQLAADALGISLPPLGGTANASVSTGVLWRVISIASLDPRMPEAKPLLERLVREAAEQRGSATPEELG